MNEWINVKDRLPDEYKEVIIYGNLTFTVLNFETGTAKQKVEKKKQVISGFLEDKENLEWIKPVADCYKDCATEVVNVTHWQPLPKPPKEE